MVSDSAIMESVKDYYGRVLGGTKDLKTSACCTTEAIPAHLRGIVSSIHPEVLERFYGCGSPIPAELERRTVLDLGCGTGRDCFLLSRLVGPEGRVMGVDMTSEQLGIARRHQQYHAGLFGHAQSNVDFRQGYIEDLESLGVADASVDVVISNCVINLSPAKSKVFAEVFRVLKPGGELHFSDVFAGRRVPAALATDPVLRAECLGGALYIEDFRRMMREVGCLDYRVLSRTPLALRDTELIGKIGMVDFYSMTIRAFKLAELEDLCEDYGQVATYLGTVPEAPHAYVLDDHHRFETGRPMTVCGNTAAMLAGTRLARHFRITGDRSTHFGAFPCGPQQGAVSGPAGACC